MNDLSRRDFNAQTMRSVMLAMLGLALWRRDALAGPLRNDLVRWVNDLDGVGRDLKELHLPAGDVQKVLEGYLRDTKIEELLAFIDFDRLTAGLKLDPDTETERDIVFPSIDGIPKSLHFKPQLVALAQDRSIPPHGHNNQMTAHLILRGKLHVRHFDREDEAGPGKPDDRPMLLTPTIDATFEPGNFSTISDTRDNVHWLSSLKDTAFIFNLVVTDTGTRPDRGVGRACIDPDAGERLTGGRLRAPRVHWRECYRKYFHRVMPA